MSTTEQFIPQLRVRRRERTRATRRGVVTVVLVALGVAGVGAAGVGAARLLSHPGAPVSLDAYVDGRGVQFAPAGAGYTVRLPHAPQVVRSVVHDKGYDITTRAATVTTRDYEFVLDEVTFSFRGVPAARARDTERLLARPTMQHAIGVLLSEANVTGAHTVDTTVGGFPAIVYRGTDSPLNGSVAAAAVFAHGGVYAFLVHSDRGSNRGLAAFERSLRFVHR